MIDPTFPTTSATPAPTLSSRSGGSADRFESVLADATTSAAEAPDPPESAPRPAPAPAAAGGFVKTQDSRLPHLPRFADVPDAVKHPMGPYRQAPAEHGGDWWLVNPFAGAEPWLRLDAATALASAKSHAIDGPPEFIAVFGQRPVPDGLGDRAIERRIEVIEWEQNLKHFKQAGIPEGFSEEQVRAAAALFQAWGVGEPAFYEGRYGWQARFANGFEASPHAAIETPHLVIAGYQVRMAQQGLEPSERHPFVPPHVWPSSASDGGSEQS